MMRSFKLLTGGLLLAVALLAGCSAEKKAPPGLGHAASSAEQTARLAGLPIEMTVKQRSTTKAPGAQEALSVTVDDVTRGQVMVSLAGEGGAAVLGPTSLAEGDAVEFTSGGGTYYLLLKKLNNELIGDDSATLVISDVPPEDASSTRADAGAGLAASSAERGGPARGVADGDDADVEAERIDRLLEDVGSLTDAVFVRNGEEHAPAEAVAHLRRKLEAAGGEIATAEQFIDRLATKSSLTGEPYVIRRKDGTETPAGEYLRQRLAEMERAPRRTEP